MAAPGPKRARVDGGAPDTPVSDIRAAGGGRQAPAPAPAEWQLAFSRTRKRYYYFHSGTNQSLFEPPGDLDRCTLQVADLNAPCNARLGTEPGQPPVAATDYVRWLKQANRHPHPHPYHELLRAEALDRLRTYYETVCRERLHWEMPPRESFNHWIWHMQAQAAVVGRDGRSALPDPVLALLPEGTSGAPRDTEGGAAGVGSGATGADGGGVRPPDGTPSAASMVAAPLRRQLMESLPANLRNYKYLKTGDRLLRTLHTYIDSSLFLSQTYGRGANADADLAIVRAAADEALAWARGARRPPAEEAMARLEAFRAQSIPALQRLLNGEIDEICTAMTNAARGEAVELSDKTKSKVAAASTFDPPLNFAELAVRLDGSVIQVSYHDSAIPLQHRHWDKLCALYNRLHPDQELLLPRLWCMLRRYQTVFGARDNAGRAAEGGGFQAAIPVALFKALQANLGVGLECFASPLNCYLPAYCSAFADTDRFFGSLGSFFHLDLVEGSCEANPPFNVDIMGAMADRIEELLARPTAGALSFAVVVPEWNDPPTPALETMKASRFLRADAVVPALKHTYRVGLQHLHDEASEPFSAIHDSHLFILQNDLGAERWPATPEVLRRLLDAWMGTDTASSAVPADGRLTPAEPTDP